MACHITRLAIGTINGTNRLFRTVVPYRTGSVQPILNGQFLTDAWVEQGGDKVLMDDPPLPADGPRPADVLQLQFIPL